MKQILEPKHTALLIVDVQNDFCSEGGFFAKDGSRILGGTELVHKLRSVLQRAREVGVLPVYIQYTHLKSGRSDSPAWRRARYSTAEGSDYCVQGTWGHEIIADLKPLEQEPVIQKFRGCAFINTGLNNILHSQSIQTTVITGLVTEGCAFDTACGATANDYFVVVVSDCLGSYEQELYDAALTILRKRYDVVSSRELVELWKKSP